MNFISIGTFCSIKTLKLKDVLYLEAIGKYTLIYFIKNDEIKSICSTKNLGLFQKKINKYFIRVHYKYLVNANHILEMENKKNKIKIRNDIIIPVSRRRKKELVSILV